MVGFPPHFTPQVLITLSRKTPWVCWGSPPFEKTPMSCKKVKVLNLNPRVSLRKCQAHHRRHPIRPTPPTPKGASCALFPLNMASMEVKRCSKSLHPRKLTNVPWKGIISIGNTSSNHWFSGDMLVFQGVRVHLIGKKKRIPQVVLEWVWFGYLNTLQKTGYLEH